MKLKTLIEPGDPERIATGFQFTEGPVWMPGGTLLFSDIPASRIYKWTPDRGEQVEVWREPSGNSNGLTVDRQGRLVACEHGNRRVSRTEGDGTVVTLADRYRGGRLNSPNDVVVKSDGTVYFTDPPYGIEPHEREHPCLWCFLSTHWLKLALTGRIAWVLRTRIFRMGGLRLKLAPAGRTI